MATISTSIELYDRVSRPINSMIAALGNMCDAYESVERAMDGGFDTSTIEQARSATERAALEVIQLGNEIEQNENHQRDFNQQVHNGTSAMNGLLGKVGAMVGAYASLQTVKKAMDLSDTLVQNRARLDLMNDGLQTTDELVQMVYNSAQNARGSFTDMAAVVARFGNNARDAFKSNEEVIAFTNLIQKQMTIAGASTQEAASAILQLSQGLGSGVLRGEELNAVFEQAPNIIQSIADYLDVPIGKIREMASDGQITADIVKNAVFSAADDINSKFEEIPMTWGQIWTMMGNATLMQFQPVLDKINELANNQQFQTFATGVIDALSGVALILLEIMEFAGAVAGFFVDNWSVIEPIVWGIVGALGMYLAIMAIVNAITAISAFVAGVKAAADMMQAGATFVATAAQHGLNAALLACPLTWIILLIIALIAVIYAVCQAIANMTGIATTGFGIITGGINVVIQFFKNLGLQVANIAIGIGNAISALCSNMMTAFSNAISSVQSWFYGLLSTAASVIAGIAAELNKLPFVEFDYSGIVAKANEYAHKAQLEAGDKGEYQDISAAFNKGLNTYNTFQTGWASDAFQSGASWGDGVMNKLSDKLTGFFDGNTSGDEGKFTLPENLFDAGAYEVPGMDDLGGGGGYDASQIPSNIADTAGNTGAMAKSMDITSEDLKYLRDIAEKEVVNRFTTAEIKVEMTNNNNISSDMDLDGIVDHLVTGVNEAMEKTAEGVHK